MGELERFSAPGPGRTLLCEAEALAGPLRFAANVIRAGADSRLSLRFDASLGQNDFAHRFPSAQSGDMEGRAAWAVIAMWVVGRASGALAADAGLHDAEDWFAGDAHLAPCISRDLEDDALSHLSAITDSERLADLLPYVLDPVGLGTRRAVIKDTDQGKARAARKNGGIYYTPTDVAEFMLDSVGALDALDGNLVDPACGSGVFLRAALRRAVNRGHAVDAAAKRLYGIDISAWAVELCAFVLTAEAIRLGSGPNSALELWMDFRSRLLCTDALRLDLASTCPPPLPKHGFEYVVANPPYTRLGRAYDPIELRTRFRSLRDGWGAATNSYVPFVELMWKLGAPGGAPGGAAVMVVPLSVAYSSNNQISALRSAIHDAKGEWKFAFFDRTPDALFGDDVKQRCAILVRHDAASFSVATGPLQRWTSRTRSRLFTSISYTPMKPVDLLDGIPKIGSQLEAAAYRRIRGNGLLRFEDLWVRSLRSSFEDQSSTTALRIAGTAYNWISLIPDRNTAVSQIRFPAATPFLELEFKDLTWKWAAYAFLSSRMTYWLWRVEGDGFHVPKKFVASLPYPESLQAGAKRRRLAELGGRLAERITSRPIVSTNGGRETVTYCPYAEPELLDEVDDLVLEAFELPERFVDFLRHFVLSTTVVDFEDPKRVRRDGRALTGWVAV